MSSCISRVMLLRAHRHYVCAIVVVSCVVTSCCRQLHSVNTVMAETVTAKGEEKNTCLSQDGICSKFALNSAKMVIGGGFSVLDIAVLTKNNDRLY